MINYFLVFYYANASFNEIFILELSYSYRAASFVRSGYIFDESVGNNVSIDYINRALFSSELLTRIYDYVS